MFKMIVYDLFYGYHINKLFLYIYTMNFSQAIETRHALHGVRWPASNPKCLNVDFGIKNDMLKAIESTKEDAPKFGQETNKDNLLVGSGWSRERHDDDKKVNLLIAACGFNGKLEFVCIFIL